MIYNYERNTRIEIKESRERENREIIIKDGWEWEEKFYLK